MTSTITALSFSSSRNNLCLSDKKVYCTQDFVREREQVERRRRTSGSVSFFLSEREEMREFFEFLIQFHPQANKSFLCTKSFSIMNSPFFILFFVLLLLLCASFSSNFFGYLDLDFLHYAFIHRAGMYKKMMEKQRLSLH